MMKRPKHNLRAAMRYAKRTLWRYSTVVLEPGGGWGSGILIDFRSQPLLLTCDHVRRVLTPPLVVSTGGISHCTESTPSWLYNSALDVAGLLLRNPEFFVESKKFYPANECWLGEIERGDPVWAHGWPTGGEGNRRMGVVKPGYADFRPITYATLAVSPGRNTALKGRLQPRAEWNLSSNRDEKGRRFTRDLRAKQRRGMSGGAVTLSDWILPGRLAGQITHMTAREIWFNPMRDILRWLDGVV